MVFTKAEIIITCISREIINGDWVSQGIATPLVNCALMLARLTHAPNVFFYYSVGNVFSMEPGLISLSTFEKVTLGKGLKCLSFEELSLDLNAKVRPKEFFRPAQMDCYGNFNNVVIGSYEWPLLRLPGAAGIPEVTEFFHDFYLYIPRHETRCFTNKLDFISGLGFIDGQSDEEREQMGILGTGPKKVITDLGVFSFGEDRKLKVDSLHLGVTAEEVAAKTGFSLDLPLSIPFTEPPTRDQLNLIQKEIDPLSIRDLEILRGPKRLAKAIDVFRQEQNL